jgi:hypothetical protein
MYNQIVFVDKSLKGESIIDSIGVQYLVSEEGGLVN